MPRYLIEEPNPFATREEWLAFRASLAQLPADEPDVAAALRAADEVLGRTPGPQFPNTGPDTTGPALFRLYA